MSYDCLLRPKCQSSGLEVDVNLSFQDQHLRSHRTNTNKQVSHFQVKTIEEDFGSS